MSWCFLWISYCAHFTKHGANLVRNILFVLSYVLPEPLNYMQCQLKKFAGCKKKWNESGFRPPLCTYRLNWARRTSWGWWDEWDDTVLQTQDSKFAPWRCEAGHATSRSRRLPTILSFTRGWGRNIFVSFKPPRPGTEPRTLAWKAAVLTTTLAPPPPFPRGNAIYVTVNQATHSASVQFWNIADPNDVALAHHWTAVEHGVLKEVVQPGDLRRILAPCQHTLHICLAKPKGSNCVLVK